MTEIRELVENLRKAREFFEQPPSQNMTPPPKGSFTGLLTEAADTIERLQRCHRIVAKQAGFYKPELPDFTKVDIHLGVLRAAERCAGFAPWEGEEEEASITAGNAPAARQPEGGGA